MMQPTPQMNQAMIRKLMGAPDDPVTNGPEQLREVTFHLPADIKQQQFVAAMKDIVPAAIEMLNEQGWLLSEPRRVAVDGPFMALDDQAQPREGYKMFRLRAVCRPANLDRIVLPSTEDRLDLKRLVQRMSPN